MTEASKDVVTGTRTARQAVYGTFSENARVAQELKALFAREHEGDVPEVVSEGLDLISLKLSRILTGDPAYLDNWIDLAGYAMCVHDALSGATGVSAPAPLTVTPAAAGMLDPAQVPTRTSVTLGSVNLRNPRPLERTALYLTRLKSIPRNEGWHDRYFRSPIHFDSHGHLWPSDAYRNYNNKAQNATVDSPLEWNSYRQFWGDTRPDNRVYGPYVDTLGRDWYSRGAFERYWDAFGREGDHELAYFAYHRDLEHGRSELFADSHGIMWPEVRLNEIKKAFGIGNRVPTNEAFKTLYEEFFCGVSFPYGGRNFTGASFQEFMRANDYPWFTHREDATSTEPSTES